VKRRYKKECRQTKEREKEGRRKRNDLVSLGRRGTEKETTVKLRRKGKRRRKIR
jgi:hypothetical protein